MPRNGKFLGVFGAVATAVLFAGAVQSHAAELGDQAIPVSVSGSTALPCAFEQECVSPEATSASCCGDCCDLCCQPSLWTVSAGFVYWQRGEMDNAILLQPSGAAGTSASAARASDFNFGFQPGVDVSLVRNFCRDCGLISGFEVRYLGVSNSNAAFSTELPTGDNVPFAAPQPFGNGAQQFWDLSYSSSLHTVEFNLPHQFSSGLIGLAGVRWVRLEEQMEMFANSPSIPQTADFLFRTKNDLIGFQIGLKADSGQRLGRWRLDSAVKAGIYSNQAHNSMGIAVTGNGGPVPTFGDEANHVAFAGELGVGLNYLVTERLAARIGYELFYLDGVAIAGNQIQATNVSTRSGIDTSGNALFQGLNAGLTFTF